MAERTKDVARSSRTRMEAVLITSMLHSTDKASIGQRSRTLVHSHKAVPGILLRMGQAGLMTGEKSYGITVDLHLLA